MPYGNSKAWTQAWEFFQRIVAFQDTNRVQYFVKTGQYKYQ